LRQSATVKRRKSRKIVVWRYEIVAPRSGGALPPFPTPTEPTISYPMFRMTRPDLAKANHVAEKEYRTSVEPLPSEGSRHAR